MKVFVDTHIFIDYYWNRKDNVKPLGEFTFQFFKRALECKYFIIISQQVIEELCRVLKVSEREIWSNVLQNLKEANKIEVAVVSGEQLREARKLTAIKHIPLNDALFSILARDANAKLVSRDRHHHEDLSEIVDVLMPEDLQ